MKESEIRPKALLQEYLRLAEIDSRQLDVTKFVKIACPACFSDNCQLHITKNNYKYDLCHDCGTLFCNPRPDGEVLDRFYDSAESSKFWSNEFFPHVAEPRREKLFKPKANRIFNIFSEKGFFPRNICDVGSGYGIFLEELKKNFEKAELYGIEPSPEMAKISNEKGIITLNASAESSAEWSHRFDLVISSEVIEHVFSPEQFVISIHRLVKSGGYALLTGLGYEGFDILTLQERSNSIFPPHHINFLSIEGFEKLFKKVGFSEVEIITPGELDIDIVLGSGLVTEFTRLISKRGDKTIAEFQDFLRRNKLSSHTWVIAKL
ncbi:class I SAM-dependent methyltransferase [Leptospira idonii]|uniref:Class I SAM-dependent methyltransferase n=1 Tax=Leptospira idonii TaxID=1193500 RepID=A0A4R9LVK4_9LEPT|nr:class I SAM-dependent methyltransferase [Leptospira idonii]TGN18274.1 class I SAM-dependent methyltransferase [Leptospira idonii]